MIGADRPRYCHCLCAHNHPHALGICHLPGYPSLLAERVDTSAGEVELCPRCHLHLLLAALGGEDETTDRAA